MCQLVGSLLTCKQVRPLVTDPSPSLVFRTVRVAMQVPVVMTTSMGQKISTVAVQQAQGTTVASGHTLLTNASQTGNANTQQKVNNGHCALEVLNTEPPQCGAIQSDCQT